MEREGQVKYGGRSLVYTAKNQKEVLWSLLLLFILVISINDFSKRLLFFALLFSIIILGLLLIKYQFEINEDYLTYQILFFRLPIYKTRIPPNEIIQIRFKRIGWSTKGAIIRVHKGFNIRIVSFAPDNVFTDLFDFAFRNDVPYFKTKDYCILEK